MRRGWRTSLETSRLAHCQPANCCYRVSSPFPRMLNATVRHSSHPSWVNRSRPWLDTRSTEYKVRTMKMEIDNSAPVWISVWAGEVKKVEFWYTISSLYTPSPTPGKGNCYWDKVPIVLVTQTAILSWDTIYGGDWASDKLSQTRR